MTTTPQLLPYLERLLDGETVEWKTLGEVAEYVRQRVAVDQLCAQTYVGVDNLLPNRAGKQDSNYLPSEGNAIAYQPNDILIGNIRPYLKKIWKADNEGGASADVLVVRITNSLLTPGYLYHLLADDRFFSYNMQHAKGAKMPRGNKEKILDYVLPIPPLRVQSRIVEILDKFTQLEAQLEAELQAELKARRKQYAYYRDQILNFSQSPPLNVNINWRTLGEVAELVRGNGLSKKDFSEYGVPAIHYGQIYTYYGNETEETLSFVSPTIAKKLQKVYPGNIVITNTSENVEDVCKAVLYSGNVEAVTGGHATIIRTKDCILPKYLVYYTLTLDFFTQKKRLAKGTKVIDVSAKDLTKIVLPLPPLSEQRRIVEILDRFDTLTNSISEGLPREIALRRKQYEYYRDALLRFPPPAPTA